MAPLISIIMPCYNSSAHLAEAVTSALEQSYSPVELIVVDDGSTDDSPEKLEELANRYQGRLHILSQNNCGPYPARNLALSQAKGDYVAFLDSDDYWSNDFLAKLYKVIETEDVDVAYCGWQNVGEYTPGDKPYVPPPYEDGDLVKQFLAGCPWPIHAALIKREVLRSIGGFSERYFSSMDYDLWLRILTASQRIREVPEVLAFYRWHGNTQISAVKWRQVIDAWNVRRDFVRNNPSLVEHLDGRAMLKEADAFLLENAYKGLWQRDLDSALHLFRKALVQGAVRWRDLKYALPALLPRKAYLSLMKFIDRREEAM